MADTIKIDFQAPGAVESGDLIIFVGDDLKPTPAVARQLGPKAAELIARAAAAERFKGKAQSAMTIAAPAGLSVDRLVAVGVGGEKDRGKLDGALLGGLVAGKVSGRTAVVALDLPGVEATPDLAAEMALGARLRAYSFDRYKTKKKDAEKDEGATRLTFAVANPAAARNAAKAR